MIENRIPWYTFVLFSYAADKWHFGFPILILGILLLQFQRFRFRPMSDFHFRRRHLNLYWNLLPDFQGYRRLGYIRRRLLQIRRSHHHLSRWPVTTQHHHRHRLLQQQYQ
jgi:hypothetical protein